MPGFSGFKVSSGCSCCCRVGLGGFRLLGKFEIKCYLNPTSPHQLMIKREHGGNGSHSGFTFLNPPHPRLRSQPPSPSPCPQSRWRTSSAKPQTSSPPTNRPYPPRYHTSINVHRSKAKLPSGLENTIRPGRANRAFPALIGGLC